MTDVPVPSACAILVCLFMLQHYGTHKIGFMFAPIVIIWLLLISGVGIYNIFHWNHHIIYAISPVYMYKFIRNAHINSWRSLGSIILCVAGWLMSMSLSYDIGIFIFYIYVFSVLRCSLLFQDRRQCLQI